MSLESAFARTYPFPLDDFQLQANHSLVEGRSVLVCAPTGAGKTVVGEFGVWLALQRGGKAFYTTPLKALSNQKFGDFIARRGADRRRDRAEAPRTDRAPLHVGPEAPSDVRP